MNNVDVNLELLASISNLLHYAEYISPEVERLIHEILQQLEKERQVC